MLNYSGSKLQHFEFVVYLFLVIIIWSPKGSGGGTLSLLILVCGFFLFCRVVVIAEFLMCTSTEYIRTFARVIALASF